MKNIFKFQRKGKPLFFFFSGIAEKTLNILHIKLPNLSPESLMKMAMRSTRLSDWGDEGFMVPFNKFLESCENNAQLNLIGKTQLWIDTIRLLSNRLRVQNDFTHHPEILDEKIDRPLIITGLPRTGTTLLHNLISLDPTFRPLLYWEGINPSPSPVPEKHEKDFRIYQARAKLFLLQYLAPEFMKIKPIIAKRPEECITLLSHAFLTFRGFSILYNIKDYITWLDTQDMTPAYAYHRQLLKLLQWKYPTKHWLLKAPEHLMNLGALLSTYPDACVVQTHRNPVEVIPSSCSMLNVFRSVFSDHINVSDFGKETMEWTVKAAERSIETRKQSDPERFHDVYYTDLVKDPIRTVQNLYTRFGYELSPSTETEMRKYLDQNPQHKRGVHHYTPEQYGLTPEMIKEAFSDYCAHFNISM